MELVVFIHVAVTIAFVGDVHVSAERVTVAFPVASVIAQDEERLPAVVVKVRFAPATGFASAMTTAVIVESIVDWITITVGDAVS